MEPEGEFQDWEVVHHNSDSEPLFDDVALEQTSDFVADSEGIIHNNYFCLESHKNHVVSDDSDVSSKASDNPSWIDPAFETQYPRKHSWSDSGSDQRFTEFEGKSDVGFVYNDQIGRFQEEFDGVGHISTENGEKLENFLSDSRGVSSGEVIVESVGGIDGKSDVGFVYNDQKGRFHEEFDGVGHINTENDETLGGLLGDSSGVSSGEVIVNDEFGLEKDEILGEENGEGEGEVEVRRVEEKRKSSGVVWWKLPIELLRYCVFKGPVWTVSVAAAFMGFVILGRRLYKMKKKSRDLGNRITMDDKKISQFMTRAARLNEAFSVVKRVPIIRPSLPAGGVTPWPVMSLR